MSTNQARLVAAITDAMEAKGISQNTLGRKSGVAQSMISAAILGKYDLKEEKWRLICEALELEYDEIIADAELPPSSPNGESTSLERAAGKTPDAEEIRGGTVIPLSAEQKLEEDLVLNEEERRLMNVTARYLAGHLKEDVRKGMDISLEDLHTLLTVCKRMQEAAEGKDK